MNDALTTALVNSLTQLPIVAILLYMWGQASTAHTKSIEHYRQEGARQRAFIEELMKELMRREITRSEAAEARAHKANGPGGD